MSPREISLFDDSLFAQIRSCIESDGLIIYPTDTCYGVGANAQNNSAVLRVFNLKKRKRTKPISVVVSRGTLAEYAQITEREAHFVDKFLPGPLSVVLYQSGRLSKHLNIDEPTKIAFRIIPSQFRISEFVDTCHMPLTATSANISESLDQSLPEIIRSLQLEDSDLIIRTKIPLSFNPSAIVDMTFDPPKILREGILSQKLRAWGCV
ncbi:MAG: L-threonylcarbamoyladenylate synthase [Candidatus Hodarchaeales archaeon]